MTASLQAVLDHGERKRDAQLTALRAAEQALARVASQGEQLRRYHAELAGRAPGSTGAAVGIDELRRHRAFVDRIEQAMALQRTQAGMAAVRRDTERSLLLALEVRLAGLRKLVERREAARVRAGERREQRHTDDATAQRLRRLHPPAPETVY